MKQKAGYKGYKSYDYLEESDYVQYKLAQEIDRVEPYIIPLSEKEEAKFERLVKDGVFINLHDHPTILTDDLTELMDYEHEGQGIDRLRGALLFLLGRGLRQLPGRGQRDHLEDGLEVDGCDPRHGDALMRPRTPGLFDQGLRAGGHLPG